MPWGRLDDSLYDHPKVETIPPEMRNACVGLWVRALSWCNRFLTDGIVPAARLERLDGTVDEISQLVGAGLLERLPGNRYAIHDFLSFNDSAALVRERRQRMRELARRGGERSAEARRFKQDASTVTPEPPRFKQDAQPVPAELPSRPVYIPSSPRAPAREENVENQRRDERTEAQRRFDHDYERTMRERVLPFQAETDEAT